MCGAGKVDWQGTYRRNAQRLLDEEMDGLKGFCRHADVQRVMQQHARLCQLVCDFTLIGLLSPAEALPLTRQADHHVVGCFQSVLREQTKDHVALIEQTNRQAVQAIKDEARVRDEDMLASGDPVAAMTVAVDPADPVGSYTTFRHGRGPGITAPSLSELRRLARHNGDAEDKMAAVLAEANSVAAINIDDKALPTALRHRALQAACRGEARYEMQFKRYVVHLLGPEDVLVGFSKVQFERLCGRHKSAIAAGCWNFGAENLDKAVSEMFDPAPPVFEPPESKPPASPIEVDIPLTTPVKSRWQETADRVDLP